MGVIPPPPQLKMRDWRISGDDSLHPPTENVDLYFLVFLTNVPVISSYSTRCLPTKLEIDKATFPNV